MFWVGQLVHEMVVDRRRKNFRRMNDHAVHSAARPPANGLGSSSHRHSPHSKHTCTCTVLPRRESRIEWARQESPLHLGQKRNRLVVAGPTFGTSWSVIAHRQRSPATASASWPN